MRLFQDFVLELKLLPQLIDVVGASLAMLSFIQKLTLRVIFQTWRLLMVRTECEALRTEVASLQMKSGKAATSIWNMDKSALVEKAIRDLGYTRALAQSKTVKVLRELLRRQKDIEENIDDPLHRIPKGLEKMRTAELIAEMEKRGLPVQPNMRNPAMILAIRDQVDQYALISQRPMPSQSSASENEFIHVDQDMDQSKKSRR
ncbi:MAG: hypothetical protein CMJ88_04125 [Planctomycetes bacterium]|nr:hypothetical protein [Planctomycetota bacterium]